MYKLERIVNFAQYLIESESFNRLRNWYNSPSKRPIIYNTNLGNVCRDLHKLCDICGQENPLRYCDRHDKEFEGSRVCLDCYLGDFLNNYMDKKFTLPHATYTIIETSCYKLHITTNHVCVLYPKCAKLHGQCLVGISPDDINTHLCICIDCLDASLRRCIGGLRWPD
jgi:hypothetical protein